MNKPAKILLITFISITLTGFSQNPSKIQKPAAAQAAHHDSTSAKPKVKTEEITYKADGGMMKGFIAYIPDNKGTKPAILIVPEWWGYNRYAKKRAIEIAQMGYIAIVVDIYGEGKEAKSVDEAKNWSTEYYKNPELGKAKLMAAENRIKAFALTDTNKIAVIGYCFGGTMALDGALMGMDFRGTVSFHGGLSAVVPAVPGMVKGKILICHGGADKFVSMDDANKFRRSLDSVGVRYAFKIYPDAGHAFTNPEATANGKKYNLPIAYNEKADKQSWNDMKQFLRNVFYMK